MSPLKEKILFPHQKLFLRKFRKGRLTTILDLDFNSFISQTIFMNLTWFKFPSYSSRRRSFVVARVLWLVHGASVARETALILNWIIHYYYYFFFIHYNYWIIILFVLISSPLCRVPSYTFSLSIARFRSDFLKYFVKVDNNYNLLSIQCIRLVCYNLYCTDRVTL